MAEQRPYRRFRAKVGLHADQRAGLIWALRKIADQLEAGETESFRGAWTQGAFAVELTTDLSMTPDRYIVELSRWQEDNGLT